MRPSALLGLALVVSLAACGDDAAAPTAELKVGLLAAGSGDGGSLGARALAAANAAVNDWALAAPANGAAIVLDARDTRFEPATAAAEVAALADAGARIIVGPASSAEVTAAKPIADARGVLLVSYGSTAGALSLPDDNVLRLVPDDGPQGVATVGLAFTQGIRAIVPAWRGDPGNDGLEASVRRAGTQRGIEVTAGVRYASTTTDFAPVVATLRTQVAAAVAARGAGAVAVYLGAFDESAALLAAVGTDPTLTAVRWYGGDGMNESAAVLSNAAAARAAVAVRLRTANYAIDDGILAAWRPLAERVLGPGAAAEPSALAAYDATILAARTLGRAGASADAAALRTEFVRQAAAYVGASGATTLNANGDRVAGDFAFAVVCPSGSAWVWRRAEAWRAATSTVVSRGGC
jgi:branched-chain amino acid transport system substrate-binding protein